MVSLIEGPASRCKECGKGLGALPPTAKNKVFCCQPCRYAWHNRQHKEGLQALKVLQGLPPAGEGEKR